MVDDSSEGRRRERRRAFRSDCRIEPGHSAASLLDGPVSGHTVNITEHGLMLATPSMTPGDVAQWQERIDRDEPILVQVALNAYPTAPPLRAQVVWTNWADDEELGPVARIGMLFQVISGEQREILREILSGLATRPDV